jgi:hypothetical protein
MLSETSTNVELYVTVTSTKRISLQAIFPARHDTVSRQMISVSTFSRPTSRSRDGKEKLYIRNQSDSIDNVVTLTRNRQLFDEVVHARFAVFV